MSQDLCNFHCGTRIDLDQQLLEERQCWKQKYCCLLKQTKQDIENMKQSIYMQCADLMQKQFNEKEKSHSKIVNEKNEQIKNLITRIIQLQTQIKIVSKQKEIIEHKLENTQIQTSQKQNQINMLKSKISKLIREWQLKNEQDLIKMRKQLNNESKDQIEKLQLQKQHLKHKVKQFEQKYNKIIPQVQKMKNLLSSKCCQVQQLSQVIQKQNKNNEQRIQKLKQQIRDLQKMNSKYCKHNKQLIDQLEQTKKQLQKFKKITKQVKVQAVYVDRPVQVQKVVEKIVQVEKVVKKYVDNPNNDKINKLEEQNHKLVIQLNRLLGQLKQMQQTYKHNVQQYEQSIKCYQKNQHLYKKQRQALAHKLSQQSRQIDLLQQYMNKSNSKTNDNQKIVVHVKQDGTYQKTVQKVGVNNRKKK